MQLKNLEQVTKNRKHLLIREVENYNVRLRNGEKKRDIEKEEVLRSLSLLGFDSIIAYKESGQPFLENYPELFLSISHSRAWMAVYVSEKPVGIDIEFENSRIFYGASYYINEKEEHYISDIKCLHIIWGAKEAFYKWKEGKVENTKDDITITSIDMNNNKVKVLFQDETHVFDFLQEDEITLVLN